MNFLPAVLWLMLLGPSKIEEPSEYSNLKRVAATGVLSVYTISIDGEEYVVVESSSGGVAIYQTERQRKDK